MDADQHGPDPGDGRPISLLVPAYAHPAVAPDLWRRLVAAAPVLRAVIVNPASGPGVEVDPGYPPVLGRLREARVRLLGYVDTDYGRRPVHRIEADLAAYRELYGIRDVFFDQVTTGPDALDHYADVVLRARAAGARFVTLNPGAPPDPGYLELAELVVSFEGPWRAYRDGAAEMVRAAPPGKLCHLVYGMARDGTAEAFRALLRRARAAGVTTVFGSDGIGDNPWDVFPDRLVHDLTAEHDPGRVTPAGPVAPRHGGPSPEAARRG